MNRFWESFNSKSLRAIPKKTKKSGSGGLERCSPAVSLIKVVNVLADVVA